MWRFFIGTYATYQVNTDSVFFKGILYLWGYSFLSFFTCFFNEINLLYVYSLNKSDKVCNVASPVVCVQTWNHVHVELHSKFLTLETVDKTISVSE